MTIATARPRTWRFPRLILEDHIVLAEMIWAGFMITTMGVAVGIAFFSDVTGSVLVNAGNVAPWYVAFLVGYVMYQTVPMFIAHGRTRRDTGIEAVVFMVTFAAAVSLMVSVGYLIEYAVYGIAGWSRDLSGDHLFSSHLDVPMIFTEYWLNLLVWSAAGGFVGAAFYRYDRNGWLALLPAAILVSLVGMISGPQFMEFVLQPLPSIGAPSLWALALLSIACFLASIALTWPIVRDLPLRNR